MEPHPIDLTKRYGLPMQPVSLEPNISPEYFERERDVIFRHAWLNVGRTHDIPNIGDYLVKEMHILRTSVLVVRGRDGQIRAFHNMCRHRGNKLCATGSESGNARGFSCAFHGWTYDPEGQLVIVPDEDQFLIWRKRISDSRSSRWASGRALFSLTQRPRRVCGTGSVRCMIASTAILITPI